jgi:uncharacterized protein YggE
LKSKLYTLLFILFAVSTAAAQTIPPGPHVVVNGHAKRSYKPDMFTLPMELSTLSKDASTAAQIEKQTLSLVAQLKNIGVKDEDIKVDNLSIQKEHDDNMRFVGNWYSRSITVNFDSKQNLIKFLSEINGVKNLEISSIKSGLKNIDLLKLDLMKDAVANSKHRADSLAALYGMRVLGVHTISTTRISGDEGSYGSNARTLDRVEVTGSRIRRVDAETKKPIEQVIEEGTIDLEEDIYTVFLLGK